MSTSPDVAVAPKPGASTDPSLTALEEVAGAELAGIAGRPLYSAAVFGAWIFSGLVVARYLARRGHEAGPITVLGVLTGPFLLGLARANLLPREASTPPIVLSEGASRDGTEDVLVAIGDGPPFDEVVASVRALGARLRRLTFVHCMTYELVWDDDDDARAARDTVADVLTEADLQLPEIHARLVLLPGASATAVDAYAMDAGIDHVLHAAPPTPVEHTRR